MAENGLMALVKSLPGMNRESFFTAGIIALQRVSFGVQDGAWSEAGQPDEFSELRTVLKKEAATLLAYPEFMRRVRSQRSEFPRTHWWWWIEEL